MSDRFTAHRDPQASKADLELATNILMHPASATWQEMAQLAERLKDARQFGYARRLFACARMRAAVPDEPADIQLQLTRRLALCTYRDLDLPVEQRFSDALELLNEADLRAEHPDAETLGLAGAVFKNKWKYGGLRADLERSLTYYSRAAVRGVEHDFGYTSINAAYVLDALAHAEKDDSPRFAAERTAEARLLRQKISAELAPLAQDERYSWLKKNWWYYATLTESAFGLRNFQEADRWLRAGLALEPPEWQLELLARQLTALAVAQEQSLDLDSEALRLLRLIVGDAAASLGALAFGKVGLALSGGGFRASLFHIGVLARLAELDILRHIEVLSCVSGGSIVGACYYLEVRDLLKKNHDAAITREHYIKLVERVAENFTAGIRKNLRTRLFASWLANLRTLFVPAYTRTTLLGDFFEEHLYSRVADGNVGPRWLNELLIEPPGEPADFNPKWDNWRRAAKAPILLLNATTLNTGHNWQFAVSWMGEPPLGATSVVDRNDIFRRLWYWQAPPPHRRIRLGQAVAASACVPALFDPVELNGLFPGASLQLVDGGVHDNQGTMGLVEQECTVIIVSDASGQSRTENRPSGESPAVALRSNDLLMGRVREAEFREMDLLKRSSALSGFAFLHLKKDLQARQLDWVDCNDPYAASGLARPRKAQSTATNTTTSYGMPYTVQARLAALRTDLDSFCEMEAQALMLSGYRMATADFAANLTQWPATAVQTHSWKFLEIAAAVDGGPGFESEQAELLKVLSVGAFRGFKVWRLRPYLSSVLGLLFLAGLAVSARVLNSIWKPAGQAVLNWSALALAGVMLVILVLWLVPRLFGARKSFTVIVTGCLLVGFGWLVAWLHVGLFDRIYLRTGKIRRKDGAQLTQGRVPS